MEKRLSLLLGIGLVLCGGLALAANLFGPLIGWGLGWAFSLSWPMVVIGVGLAFVIPPLLWHERRGLGGLFIPGMPILTTGGLLLVANTFNWWDIWGLFWPLEVLALATGFMLAAFWLRVVWLAIPASIIGLTAVVLQFCALTGWWEAWAALWTVEPLALGLALLGIGILRRSGGLSLAGAMLSGFAGFAFAGMLVILFGSWRLFSMVGPSVLILAGVVLLAWSLLRRPPARDLATQ
ncbi:MAG: hypothetical protein AB1894_02475 [Chloroflexota bacterium]